MIDGKKVLAIIPARGGSKRLPRKNVLLLAGKPLLVWTIDAAKNSKYIDKIVVSTEDAEIFNIAKENGVDVLKRPYWLATDETETISVVKHVIENIEEFFYYTVLLQPTSPLREYYHIDEAFELLKEKGADAVISVCPLEYPIQWCNILPEDLSMVNFLSEDIKNKRSQDFPIYYRLNGAIYIAKTERLLMENTFFLESNIYAYIMNRENSVDIDDLLDFKFAEFLKNLQLSKNNK